MNLGRWAWILLPLLAACATDFTPASFVDKPRVLGIVAEPPEVVPKEGAVALRAVVATALPNDDHTDPFPAVKTRYWDGCLVSLGPQAAYQCVAPLLWTAEGETVSFEGSGIEEQMDAFKEGLPEFLQYYRQIIDTEEDQCMLRVLANWDECTAQHPDVPQTCIDPAFGAMKDCFFKAGLEVMFHLTVQLEDETRLESYKRVRFRDPGDGTILPNANPGFALTVGEVVVGCVNVPPGEQAELGCPAEPPAVETCPGAELEMVPKETKGSLEKIQKADGTKIDEALFYSFFTDAGELQYLHSVPATPENKLTMPGSDEMPATTTVWVFFRDDRGGAAYLTFPITLRTAPACGILEDPVAGGQE